MTGMDKQDNQKLAEKLAQEYVDRIKESMRKING